MPQLAKKWHRLHSKWGTAHREAHTLIPRAREVWKTGRWPDPACWGGQGSCGSSQVPELISGRAAESHRGSRAT